MKITISFPIESYTTLALLELEPQAKEQYENSQRERSRILRESDYDKNTPEYEIASVNEDDDFYVWNSIESELERRAKEDTVAFLNVVKALYKETQS